MTNLDWNTLAVMATVFGTGVSVAGYIESRFRRVEGAFWKEMRQQQKDNNVTFADFGRRIQTLEINRFGHTKAP